MLSRLASPRRHQIVLAVEVLIERALGDFCARRNLIERHTQESLSPEQSLCRIQNALPRLSR
jgi:hypothetical protein